MQRVKGAMFFQLPPPPPAQHAIKISRLQCIHRLLSLSLFGRKPCVCVCLTCQISGAALHGLREEPERLSGLRLVLCARAIFAQVVSYTRCQLLQSRRNLLLFVLRQTLAACPRFRERALFPFFRTELARHLWNLPQLDCYRESRVLLICAIERNALQAVTSSTPIPKRISSIGWEDNMEPTISLLITCIL